MKRVKLFLSVLILSLFTSVVNVHAQGFGFGGDDITSTVSNAGSYLQRILMVVYVVAFVIAAAMMTTAKSRAVAVASLVAILVAVALTSLAPTIIATVQGFGGVGAVIP